MGTDKTSGAEELHDLPMPFCPFCPFCDKTILEHTADRCLEAWVARIRGWWQYNSGNMPSRPIEDTKGERCYVPPYLTEWSACGPLLQALPEYFALAHMDTGWCVWSADGPIYVGDFVLLPDVPTPQEAILRAYIVLTEWR